jgi:hypothetical protein
VVLVDADGRALCVRVCLAVVVAERLSPLALFADGAGALNRDVGISVVVLEDMDATESGRAGLSLTIMDAGLEAILD